MNDAPIKLEPLKKRKPLAARRELNGVSLNDIAERTRIPLHHLVELEQGDISQWPAGVYAKSWAREYAVEAGLDPDEVIAVVAPVAAVEPTIEEIRHAREEGERLAKGARHPLHAYASRIAAVAVVVVLLLLAGLFLARYQPERRSVPEPQPVGTSGVTPAVPR